MIEYDRVDISEDIDINKTNKSKKCMLCHYWVFLDNNFSYRPYLSDGCYNIILLLFMLKKVYAEFTFSIWVNVKQKN